MKHNGPERNSAFAAGFMGCLGVGCAFLAVLLLIGVCTMALGK